MRRNKIYIFVETKCIYTILCVCIYIYIYICQAIGQVGRMFAHGPGDLGLIPVCFIQKTHKNGTCSRLALHSAL